MTSDTQKLGSEETQQQEAEAVARFLREHPDFFVGREELLRDLRLPHESGSAISLLEKQVELLRERNQHLNRQMNEFITNAGENDSLFEKTRIIILELLKARSLAELSDVLERELTGTFGAETSRLLLLSDELDEFQGIASTPPLQAEEMLGEPIKGKRTFCGDIEPLQAGYLFPDAAGPIVSAAIIPIHLLDDADLPAFPVLVIGSGRPLHFNNNQDTLFLDFIGEVLAALIVRLR